MLGIHAMPALLATGQLLDYKNVCFATEAGPQKRSVMQGGPSRGLI